MSLRNSSMNLRSIGSQIFSHPPCKRIDWLIQVVLFKPNIDIKRDRLIKSTNPHCSKIKVDLVDDCISRLTLMWAFVNPTTSWFISKLSVLSIQACDVILHILYLKPMWVSGGDYRALKTWMNPSDYMSEMSRRHNPVLLTFCYPNESGRIPSILSHM